MKVFEILHGDIANVSEEQIVNRLKKLDWKYEFSDDFYRASIGKREMELVENMVYRFWKKEPERAVAVWWENSPISPSDKTVVPSFILALGSQDK